MVLDQLILAAMLSSSPIAHTPAYGVYAAPSIQAYVESSDQPSDVVFRDALPGARTDKFALERPRARYQK